MVIVVKNKVETEFEEHQQTLFNKGFVQIPNAFSTESVVEFRETLDQLFEEINKNQLVHHASSLDAGPESIVEVNHALKSSPELKNSELFTRAKVIANALFGRKVFRAFDHAIYKPPLSGKISWHQDEAYRPTVKKMSSIHFWIPLHDVGPEEGGMQYIPQDKYSESIEHKKHDSSHTLFAEPPEESLKFVEKCSTKLGDLVVHTPSTLHSSLPNKSTNTRKAWIVHFNPYGPFEVLLPGNILGFIGSRLKGASS